MKLESLNSTALLVLVGLVAHTTALGALPRSPATQSATGMSAAQRITTAQEPTSPGEAVSIQNPVVFSASIEMVRVPVVVRDIGGAFISGLDPGNFLVEDGPALQQVEHFVSDNEPTTVGIVLDASAAMGPYVDVVRAATEKIADELRKADELLLIAAGSSAELLSPLSMDRDSIKRGLARFSPGRTGGRALFDAVALGLSELDYASHEKRVLIVITTGDDSTSRVGTAELMRAAQRLGVTIHAIQMSVRTGESVQELVRLSGGLIAARPGIEDRYGGVAMWVDLAISDICRYVNNQYLLHYTPLSPPPPGMWRRIRIKVDVPFEEVRARSGYVR